MAREDTEAKLLGLARGYYRTIEAAQGNVPESTRLVLRRQVNGYRLSWALSLILAGGRIVEQGTHAELLARGGRYWELLRRQQLVEELEREAV